jgi:hypothetical protein
VIRESGTYKVKVTNSFGCESTSTDFTVTTLALPTKPVLTSSAGTELCDPETTNLTSSVTTNLQWYKDGTPIPGATQSILTVNNSGDYYVSASTSNGSCFINSDVTSILVNPKPPKPLITIDSTTLNSTLANFYQWFKNDTEIPFATQQSYTVTETGNYKVEISDDKGCTNTSDSEFILISGIQNTSAFNHVNVYPNPTSGTFTLQYSLVEDALVSINMINVLGQVIQEIDSKEVQLKGMYKIELNETVKGIYIIQLNTSKGSKELKLIVK